MVRQLVATMEKGAKHTLHLILGRFNGMAHPVQWHARRFRRVACISNSAEMLVTADAMSDRLCMKVLRAVINAPSPPHPTIDSTLLQCLSTSVKEPNERYNQADLIQIREPSDESDLN